MLDSLNKFIIPWMFITNRLGYCTTLSWSFLNYKNCSAWYNNTRSGKIFRFYLTKKKQVDIKTHKTQKLLCSVRSWLQQTQEMGFYYSIRELIQLRRPSFLVYIIINFPLLNIRFILININYLQNYHHIPFCCRKCY